MMLVALLLLAATPAPAPDEANLPPAGRPYGALLSESQLVFVGWPSLHPVDGPCGRPSGTWHVVKIVRGDPSLVGKDLPLYGPVALHREPRSTMLFLKGRGDCPELIAEQEIGRDTLARAAAEASDCSLQLRAVDQVLRGLADDCDRDADCAAPPLHPRTCERPKAISARAPAAMPAFWSSLASRAQKACAAEWSKQSACTSSVVPVHCLEHRCLEGPSPSQAAPFAVAELGEGCAPTDAPAVTLTVHPQGADFPSIGVSWWGEERPRRGAAGTFSLDGEPAFGKGFGANYCPFAGGCVTVSRLRLRLNLDANGKGHLDLDAESSRGDRLHATVPAELGPAQRVICG